MPNQKPTNRQKFLNFFHYSPISTDIPKNINILLYINNYIFRSHLQLNNRGESGNSRRSYGHGQIDSPIDPDQKNLYTLYGRKRSFNLLYAFQPLYFVYE